MANETRELTAAEIKSQLAGYTGTENYYRQVLYPQMLLTDGAHAFAELAGAWWLIDLIGLDLFQAYKGSDLCDGFGAVCIYVNGNSESDIVLEDGNDNEIKRVNVPFTDLPEGEYTFFIEYGGDGNHVLMLPRER